MTAEKTGKQLDIVEKVVANQFRDAREVLKATAAIKIHRIGIFRIAPRIVKKRIRSTGEMLGKAKARLENDRKEGKGSFKQEQIIKDIERKLETLKRKLEIHESRLQGNTGGSVELPVRETGDRESSGGKDINM